jgi:hypothetical protein
VDDFSDEASEAAWTESMELSTWLHRAFEDNAKIYGPNRRKPITTRLDVMFLGRDGVAYVTRKQPKDSPASFTPAGRVVQWRAAELAATWETHGRGGPATTAETSFSVRDR